MSSLRDSLLGTWRLIDIGVIRKGETQETNHPMWKNVLGSLIYSSDGYMSVQLMTPGAKPVSGGHQFTATADELADAARHYIAYAGPFDVTDADPAGAVVTHTLQLASVPNIVGTVQRRLISFEDSVEGRVLVLKAENETVLINEGEIVVLKWMRMVK